MATRSVDLRARGVALLRLAMRLSTLATRPELRPVVGFRVLAVPFLPRVGPRGHRGVLLPVVIAGAARRLWVADWTELETLREMALEGAWQDDLPQDPQVIVDLGAHIGLASLVYRARFPKARILAVEADPETALRLRANVGGSEIEVWEGAVCDRDEVVSFFMRDRSWGSSLDAHWPPEPVTEVTVRGITLDSLLDERGIDRVDLLKINVEGAEYAILASLRDPGRIRYVLGELHGDAISGEARLRSALPEADLWIGHDGYAMTFRGRPRRGGPGGGP
jgi:FkbM family methyltransferase